jgi:hypothetical protein
MRALLGGSQVRETAWIGSRRAGGGHLVAVAPLMMAAYRSCQAIDVKPAFVISWLARRRVRAFPRRPAISVGMSQGENWSTSTRRPPGTSTLAHSRRPACWSDQWSNDVVLEGAVGIGQPFGGTGAEPQAMVAGRRFRGRDHGRRGIDARHFGGLGPLPGQPPQQVTGAAADIEHSAWSCAYRLCEYRRPVGNVVVQAAAPAFLVTGGPGLEGCDIAVRWHHSSLARKSGS